MTGLLLAVCLAAAQTDAPQRGMLQPAAPTYTVAATGPTITIPITRVAGSSGTVGCTYSTVSGTATAGVDYVAIVAGPTTKLAWANNDSAPKNVTITILNDGVVNGNKTFYLQLTLPTGGAYLGVPPTGKNHEGRTLGSLPGFSAPVDWNTTTGDAILQTIQILPANNPWNEDISGLPVASNSDAILTFMGKNTKLHVNRDMNLSIVPAGWTTKPADLHYFDPPTSYADESDPGPYPIPDNMPIEGFLGDDGRTVLADIQRDINPGPQFGDRHATIIDPVGGFIYEFGNTVRDAGYNWGGTGEATFALYSNVTRQNGWTSADAAGLPILPSIVRYDECVRGMVEHAIRVTASNSKAEYVWPATHLTGTYTGTDRPRMGERFRLKKNATIDATIASMEPHSRAVAKALQKYGMFMADNGTSWYISTNSDNRLNLTDLDLLFGRDFDVVVTTGPHEGPRATSTTAITITDGGGGGGGDAVAPLISINSPTSASTYSTSSASLLLGGSSSDNVAVTSVTWTNSAGGSGTASSINPWSALVSLTTGTNTLTFTAHDAGGNTTSDVVTVTYTPPPPSTAQPSGGGGGGGGCGLTGLELLPLAFLRRRRR